MPKICFNYDSPICLDSCAGHNELKDGEQVKLNLIPKDPLWPAQIVADVTEVLPGNLAQDGYGRRYTFCFDDALLNGGSPIADCDFADTPSCYGCCDALDERVTVLENATGTVDTNTTYQYTFDEENGAVTFTATPSDGGAPFTGTVVLPAQTVDTNTTYTITNGNLVGSDGSSVPLGIQCLELRQDILVDEREVTVAGFDPATMCLEDAFIDDALVGPVTDDGIGYLGRRDGNRFVLLGKPNATYPNAFKVQYRLR